MDQLELFRDSSKGMSGKNATHSAGRGEVFHDWFPYLEGFSSSFVRTVRSNYLPSSRHIIEPFAGSGTTPIYLAVEGVDCTYCEVNPVLLHLISAKSAVLSASRDARAAIAERLLRISKQLIEICQDMQGDAIESSYHSAFGASVYFENSNFQKILALKRFERSFSESDPNAASLFSVAVYSSLLEASFLKRAGDVRFRTIKELAAGITPIERLVDRRIQTICGDLLSSVSASANPTLITGNAKDLRSLDSLQADGVITSPPYLNGTNYLRNTRLELWYLEFISDRQSLRTLRDQAVTAGINDVTNNKAFEMLPEVREIHDLVESNAYDQRIPQMVGAYFYEMKLVLEGLKRHLRKKGRLCVDIGDSIYAGIHVPTHDILTSVAESVGFKQLDKVLLRERLSHNKAKLSQQLLVFER